MLYQLKPTSGKTIFVPLKPASMVEQGLLEKTMEQWLADNPSAVLPEDEERVLVISQESPFENVTDIIAIDQDGSVVIVEVKRGQTPRDVIAQALEYVSDVAEWDYGMLNARALRYFARRNLPYKSLLEAFSQTFEAGDFLESDFNEQQRIFIVGERIDEKIARTAHWLLDHAVSINCISYTCYVSENEQMFLDFQEVVHDTGPGHDPKSVKPPTEEEAVERLPDDLKEVYIELRLRVSDWAGVHSYATRRNLIFKATRNFAEICEIRRDASLSVGVRPEGFEIPENQSAQVHGIKVTRVPDSHGWTLSHWFKVNRESDLEAVTKLLRQSYDAVSGRS